MNTQEVLSQLPERTEVQEQLNTFIQTKRQELQQRQTAFQDSVAKYQQSGSDISPQAERRLTEMQQSMRQLQQSIQQQIQRRRAELLQPLYNRMDEAIAAVAEAQEIDFVLNEATSNGEEVVYYSASEQLNITDEVLQQMNATSDQN